MKLLTILLAPSLAIATGTTIPEDPPKGLAASDWSSIRAAYEAGRREIIGIPNTYNLTRTQSPSSKHSSPPVH